MQKMNKVRHFQILFFFARMQQQCSNGAVKRRDFPSVRISLSRGVPVSHPSILPRWEGTGEEASKRSHQDFFWPPSQLIESCVHPPPPDSSSSFSCPFFTFSHFYLSFQKSDHPSLRCAVTIATLYSAAGPHPLVLSSSSPSLSPFLPSSAAALRY